MNSLEWRVKQLENKIYGQISGLYNQDDEAEPICDQLTGVAKLYKEYMDTNGEKFARFKELYEKNKKLLDNLKDISDQSSELAKAELVLAYEDDLVRHLESVKLMAEKADKVLDVMKWPDLSVHSSRLDKLQTVTRDQLLQSTTIDSRTEELIEIYNEIINSFRSNIALWNQRLEAYENEEKKLDEDK